MAIFKVNINSPVYIKVANTNLADCNLNISIFSGTYQASPDITY